MNVGVVVAGPTVSFPHVAHAWRRTVADVAAVQRTGSASARQNRVGGLVGPAVVSGRAHRPGTGGSHRAVVGRRARARRWAWHGFYRVIVFLRAASGRSTDGRSDRIWHGQRARSA